MLAVATMYVATGLSHEPALDFGTDLSQPESQQQQCPSETVKWPYVCASRRRKTQ